MSEPAKSSQSIQDVVASFVRAHSVSREPVQDAGAIGATDRSILPDHFLFAHAIALSATATGKGVSTIVSEIFNNTTGESAE